MCCLNEVAYSGTVTAVSGGPSWDRIEEIAATLQEQGQLDVSSLKIISKEKEKLVPLLKDVLEDAVYSLEEVYSEAVALAAAAELEHVLESVNATTVISPNIEHDDHEEESRK